MASIQCVNSATRVLRLLTVTSNLNKTNCSNAKKSINAGITFPLQAEESTTTSKALEYGLISNGKKYNNYYNLRKNNTNICILSSLKKMLLFFILLFLAFSKNKYIFSSVADFRQSILLTCRMINGSKTIYRHFASLQKPESSYKSAIFTDQVSLKHWLSK